MFQILQKSYYARNYLISNYRICPCIGRGQSKILAFFWIKKVRLIQGCGLYRDAAYLKIKFIIYFYDKFLIFISNFILFILFVIKPFKIISFIFIAFLINYRIYPCISRGLSKILAFFWIKKVWLIQGCGLYRVAAYLKFLCFLKNKCGLYRGAAYTWVRLI